MCVRYFDTALPLIEPALGGTPLLPKVGQELLAQVEVFFEQRQFLSGALLVIPGFFEQSLRGGNAVRNGLSFCFERGLLIALGAEGAPSEGRAYHQCRQAKKHREGPFRNHF